MRAMRTTIIREVSAQIERLKRLQKDDDTSRWREAIIDAQDKLEKLEKLLPSGSGIDCGTKIDIDASTEHKLHLSCEYHHMNENGYYDGWTTHGITVTPSFRGIDVAIGGRNRNDIKDYLYEVYDCALNAVIDVWADGTITEAYDEKYIQVKRTENETDRFFKMFDPIYSGM